MSSESLPFSLVRRLFLACVGTGLTLAACGQDQDVRPPLGETSQELRSATAYYIGQSNMGAKQLALTFDDGPGARTSELSTYLKDQNIRATFFVNGACVQATALPNDSCGAPLAGATTVLAQLAADGHLVANHTTTHRNITTIPANQRIQELADTDALIKLHGKTPWNRSLFRAPYGAWSADVHTTLSTSAMNHYVGPIYWDIGGGPTDQSANATMAADWECWQDLDYTTAQCGDRYLNEANTRGRGIVLMHDSHGKTVDMVKYLVPLLKAAGYTFVRADEVPRIAADFPACVGTGCATCSGPAANECMSCTDGRYVSGGACLPCTATCAPGTYPSAACTATTDTVCAACHASCATCSGPAASDCGTCPSGFFLDDGTCKACAVCPAGAHASSACTPASDTVCTPCAPGTYASTPGASACTSCGSCDDGDACTTDTCSTTAGCTHAPIPGCGGPAGSSGTSGSSEPGVPIDDGGESSAGAGAGDSGCNASRRASTPSLSPMIALVGLALLLRGRLSGHARRRRPRQSSARR